MVLLSITYIIKLTKETFFVGYIFDCINTKVRMKGIIIL